MSITPVVVAERVAALVKSIHHLASRASAQHHAAQTVGYLRQVRDLGIINAALFDALVDVVEQAMENWQPRRDANGHLLDE
jgi:hypothetical protein